MKLKMKAHGFEDEVRAESQPTAERTFPFQEEGVVILHELQVIRHEAPQGAIHTQAHTNRHKTDSKLTQDSPMISRQAVSELALQALRSVAENLMK